MLLQRLEQVFLERQPDPAEVGGMLGLGIDANRTAACLAEALGQLDDFVERRDLKLAVVGVRSKGQPLSRAERLDLREREVFGEPAGDRLAVDRLRSLAIGKPIRDVGRAADFVSCRAISTPSFVETRSGSMKSAPISTASRYPSSVCSGRCPLAPRWPMMIGAAGAMAADAASASSPIM